ncbi:MAG: branched-chain amino acid aminotransferase [Alphaproteobacteria bacterium]|nr:branched-chain amino acid aminotransferase [Alphaproteobacteria bacterium]
MSALIPFDDRDGFIWYNGALVPWRDARIHVLTHGLHYGSCVFEGQRAYNGVVFKLKEHTERLFFSARAMGITIPYTEDQINEAACAVLKAQGLADGYLRPVVWRGSEMMAVSAQHNKIHVAIAAWAWPSYFDPEVKRRGIKLDIARWKRPSPETAPCHAKAAGLYMICTLSKHEAEAKGYQDAMMYDYRGLVAEATGANVFFVKDDVLHTPTPDCFLNGITRQTVIELAKTRQIAVVERAIRPDEMAGFSECFLVGTAAEVTPVSEVGPYRFTPGRISLTLMDDYAGLVRAQKA